MCCDIHINKNKIYFINLYRYSGNPPASGKYMATTQFEATSARSCFPCWDEPAIKATFEIFVVMPEKTTALSNMPAKEEVICCKRTMVFEVTPKMSTYLIAVIVGEFDFLEGETEFNKKNNKIILIIKNSR